MTKGLMLLADFDLFFFWRQVLMIACTVYCVVQCVRSGWQWYVFFRGRDRYTAIARQYLLVQLLRISPRRFAWELVDLALLTLITLIVIGLHFPIKG